MNKSSRLFFFVLTLMLFPFFSSGQDKNKEGFSFIAFGDMPYFLPKDYTRFEYLIQEINKEEQAFNVFIGDIKSSSTPCSEEAFLKIRRYFNQLKKPLIYTPGDNEWTDCHKKAAGSYRTEERLAVVREIFFSDTLSFGEEKLSLISQSQNKTYKKFVENKRWRLRDVSFATLHIVGSNNNLLSENPDSNLEYKERLKADIYWLNEVFAKAKEDNSLGIVLFIHADMFFQAISSSGFKDILDRLQELVTEFEKPVLLVHGDSHKFIVDKPFYSDPEKTKTLMNFTRVQVFGEKDMHAVKVKINPLSPSLFEFQEYWIRRNGD